MARRLSLEVPGVVDSYAITLLQEALALIEDENLWSFQLAEGGFLTPGLLFPAGTVGQSVGTITATPFQNTLIGDAAASAQWAAYTATGNNPLFTSLQIREPYYSIYNIVSYSVNSNGYGVITIDRPWMEPAGSGLAYMIYQCYFAVPKPNFKRFLDIRDTTNNEPINYWDKSQRDLAVEDAERTIFDDPTHFVPFQSDQRPGSSTADYMLYEMWPHPLSVLPYTFDYLFDGPPLTAPTSTVPYPLTEELLLWRARECAYLYKEAQKGEQMQRGSGADWRFLAQEAGEQYKTRLMPIRHKDDGLVNLWINKYRRGLYETTQPFATVNSQLNIGR